MKHIPSASFTFTVLLGIFAGLPALSIDLSAPTLAFLPAALGTSVAVAGMSLSLFMVGFGFGQFGGGRGSDRLGRRPILLGSLVIYTLAGVCCLFATSGGSLALARLVQGLGAGGCSVQATAMVQDSFKGDAARQKQSYVTLILSVMPMLAPALGAIMTNLWGWRSVHALLVVSGFLLVIVVYVFVSESWKPRPHPLSSGFGVADSLSMFRSSRFRQPTIINGLSYGAIFAYIAGAPIVVMNTLGLSTYAYAAVFASTALALSAGALFNARWARRVFGHADIIGTMLVTQASAAVLLLLLALATSTGSAWLLLPPLLVFCFARGVISPNIVYLAINRQRDQAGLASAVVGLTQLLLGAAASALVAVLLPKFGLSGVAGIIAVLASVAAFAWRQSVPENQLPG